MAKYRTHSVTLKLQVVQEYLAGVGTAVRN